MKEMTVEKSEQLKTHDSYGNCTVSGAGYGGIYLFFHIASNRRNSRAVWIHGLPGIYKSI